MPFAQNQKIFDFSYAEQVLRCFLSPAVSILLLKFIENLYSMNKRDYLNSACLRDGRNGYLKRQVCGTSSYGRAQGEYEPNTFEEKREQLSPGCQTFL